MGRVYMGSSQRDGELNHETGQSKADLFRRQDSADTLCVSSDPLDGVFGRIMEFSLVLYAVGDRGLCRNVSFARRLPLRDVG